MVLEIPWTFAFLKPLCISIGVLIVTILVGKRMLQRQQNGNPAHSAETDPKSTATTGELNINSKDDGYHELKAGSDQTSKGKELTVKEKFYLFLEKGFCPELEGDEPDPMYKYAKGAKKDDAGITDIGEMFCPFKQMTPGDDDDEMSDLDDDLEGEELDVRRPSSEPNFEQEVNTLEGLMRQAMTRGGKCPFMFDSKPATKNEGGKPQTSACPFSGKSSQNVSKKDEEIMKSKENDLANKWLNENISNNPEGEQEAKSDEGKENKPRKQQVKEVIDEVEATMTEDERKSEAAAIEEQMKAIMRLLELQEKKNGTDSQMEIQTQLKLYM